MADALLDSLFAHDLAHHPQLRHRVEIIVLRVAATILAEPNTTPAHNQRAALAVEAIADPVSVARRAALLGLAVTALPDLITGATSVKEVVDNKQVLQQADSLISAAVVAGWNSLAGVYTREEIGA